MDGIINVYKEKGFTSHDVVAKLRGILRQKRIGHTGTLDPDAEGVLPVCLGKATKVCEYLTDQTKTYQAVVRLGITSDTQDLSGKVLNERPVDVTESEVREKALEFEGEQMQTPPMYSALKVNGKKLYELAREGKEVERKPRKVHFHEIQVSEMELPRFMMKVTCSKGTYIRTLCHDLGEKLGCGGCMESLVRTRVGDFYLENSLTLSKIQELVQEHQIEEAVMPVEEVFSNFPKICCSASLDKRLYNGNPFSLKELKGADEGIFRLCDSRGTFVGIYQKDKERNAYFPVKMFYP